MGRRTADERTRVANPAAVAAELAEHYARILGQQADRQVSDVIRTCLRRLPSRLPIQGEDLRAVEDLIERVLRLGEVGAVDPNGSPRQIDDYIARRLGTSASGHRSVYRALRAMLGHTALVERCSRQIWVLRLAGLTDPSSKLHLALLAETPALYSLAVSGMNTAGGSEPMRATARGGDEPLGIQPSRLLDVDPSHELRAELARMDEELAAERRARAEADKRREAIDAELETLRRALDEERHARGEADVRAHDAVVQLAALERELGPLRRERDAADLRSMASAAQVTVLRQELAEVQDALAKERRARDEAEERSQAAAAQLAALEQKLGPQHRALDEQCRALRDAVERSHAASAAQIAALERELESARETTRDVQAADAATVWRLIEANQPQEAVTFLVARMHGRNVEDPLEAIPRLRQPAAALLSASQEPGTGGTAAVAADALLPAPEIDRVRVLADPKHTNDASAAADPPPSQVEPVTPGSSSPFPAAPRARPLTKLGPFLEAGTEPDRPPRDPHAKPSKVGRNEPCPCGSGKKFKRCCGQFT